MYPPRTIQGIKTIYETHTIRQLGCYWVGWRPGRLHVSSGIVAERLSELQYATERRGLFMICSDQVNQLLHHVDVSRHTTWRKVSHIISIHLH